MTIRILNKQTIKLSLSAKDMTKYEITNELVDNEEKIEKTVILKMLENFKEHIEMEKIKNDIPFKLFKTKENGCIFYINLPVNIATHLTKKEKITTPIIATFKTTTNLKNLCKNITSLYGKEQFKSNLYEINEKFIFVIEVEKKQEAKITALIKEFGQTTSKGEVKNQVIKEHYYPLFKETAIEQILNN